VQFIVQFAFNFHTGLVAGVFHLDLYTG
jgi:hypothetical protein